MTFSYIPSLQDGYLPLWLLTVSLISFLNSLQAYLTTAFTARVYSSRSNPVNALSSRTFGTWTFLSAVIRLYAAYNISDPLMYQLALWAYALAFAHFTSEWLCYGTTEWGKGLAGPVFISTGSLTWMLVQWGWYVSDKGGLNYGADEELERFCMFRKALGRLLE